MKAIRYFFLFLAFLLAKISAGQTLHTDSLEKLLTKKLADSSRLQTINKLLTLYNDINTDRSIELAEEGLGLVSSISNSRDIGFFYLNYGRVAELKGEYQLSITYNVKSLTIFKAQNDSVKMAVILNNLGIAYNQLGDYSTAIYYLLRAKEIDQALKDQSGESYDCINLADSYYNAKDYSSAKLWGLKAFLTLKEINDVEGAGYAAESLASIFIELGKLDSANILLTLAGEIGEKFSNEYLICRSTSHKGRLLLKEKNYSEAKHYFEEAIRLSHGKHFADVLLPSLLLLSETHTTMGNYVEALKHATDAFRYSISIKNKVLAMQSCTQLATIYQAQNAVTNSLKYLHLASLYKDSILEYSIQGSIQAKVFDLDLEKEKYEKNMVLSFLGAKDDELTRQRYFIISVLTLLISLVVIIFLVRKSSLERKRVNDLLVDNNFQLNKLNQEVNGLIHTIVHDLKSPLNSLQGLVYLTELESAGNEAALALLAQSKKVLAGGHEIIRQLLELRELEDKPPSPKPQPVNLNEFLTTLQAENSTYANPKQIKLLVEAVDENVEIDRLLIKRLLTNLLSNAIKFSPSGKNVVLSAEIELNRIVFKITDQGPGFTEEDRLKVFQKFQRLSARPTAGESSHGLGLAIVQLLAQQLKATIELQTEVGKGTTFTITLPKN